MTTCLTISKEGFQEALNGKAHEPCSASLRRQADTQAASSQGPWRCVQVFHSTAATGQWWEGISAHWGSRQPRRVHRGIWPPFEPCADGKQLKVRKLSDWRHVSSGKFQSWVEWICTAASGENQITDLFCMTMESWGHFNWFSNLKIKTAPLYLLGPRRCTSKTQTGRETFPSPRKTPHWTLP